MVKYSKKMCKGYNEEILREINTARKRFSERS